MYKNLVEKIFFVSEEGKNDINNDNFIDVTKEWIGSKKIHRGNIYEATYYETNDKKRYYVDGKNVVLDYSYKELEVAKWLIDTFGGTIYMLPRVNNPSGIKTADYLWNNEKWDLKAIHGGSKYSFSHAVEGMKNQANNFIFDVSDSYLLVEQLLIYVNKIFNSKHTSWVNKIILKYKNMVIAVYIRKEMTSVLEHRDHLTN